MTIKVSNILLLQSYFQGSALKAFILINLIIHLEFRLLQSSK